ncbi:hypothetical protein E2562_035119 [Oryza meyeriana var. granulata]|uniref:Uncharacterized protein n=1 Tax=Oryza meyeriana var. granulata TaxID=110450 RepID=A0A6G1FFW2_9ORYZ|nr:hypothetical protein E2562_035119 [Oryza meyeriana var. granulata]
MRSASSPADGAPNLLSSGGEGAVFGEASAEVFAGDGNLAVAALVAAEDGDAADGVLTAAGEAAKPCMSVPSLEPVTSKLPSNKGVTLIHMV